MGIEFRFNTKVEMLQRELNELDEAGLQRANANNLAGLLEVLHLTNLAYDMISEPCNREKLSLQIQVVI